MSQFIFQHVLPGFLQELCLPLLSPFCSGSIERPCDPVNMQIGSRPQLLAQPCPVASRLTRLRAGSSRGPAGPWHSHPASSSQFSIPQSGLLAVPLACLSCASSGLCVHCSLCQTSSSPRWLASILQRGLSSEVTFAVRPSYLKFHTYHKAYPRFSPFFFLILKSQH